MKKFSSTTRGSSRRTSQIKKRIGIAILVGVVLLVLIWVTPRALGAIASLIFTPIQSAKLWLSESTSNLPTYLRDRNELIEENLSLKEELALDGGNDRSIHLLKKENEELRALLGEESEQRLLAAIIGRPNALPYDVLVIDRGANEGVVKDAPVYIGDNRVIGLVTKVFAESAVIELVTTPGFVTSVFVVGPDIYTNAVGVGGGQLRVGVPQGINLNVGDPVILPAVKSGVYGEINHIDSLPTQPEQYGYVSTDIPIQSLRYVAVGSVPVRSISFEEAETIVAEGLTELFKVPVPEGVLISTQHSSSTASTSAEQATTSEESDI